MNKSTFVLCIVMQLLAARTFAQKNADTLDVTTSFNPFIQEVLTLKTKGGDMEDLLEVSTASRSLERISNAPAIIYVITEEQIKLRNYTSLEEVLADIPEVEIQKNANTEFGSIYTIRGINGNDKFIILQDGVRVSPATSSPHPIGHNYMVQHAKQIEIMLGPGSALYGADAFAGVINIITKVGKGYKGASVSTSYGRFNTTDNNMVVGWQANKASFLAYGKYFYSDQANLPTYYPNDFKWYHEEFKKTGRVRSSLFVPTLTKEVGYRPFAIPLMGYNTGVLANVGGLDIAASFSREAHSSAISDKPEFTPYFEDSRYINNLTNISMTYQNQFGKTYSRSSFLFNNLRIGSQTKYINIFSGYNPAYKYSNESTFQVEQMLQHKVGEKSDLSVGVLYQKFAALAKTNDLPKPFDPETYFTYYYPGTDIKDANGRSLGIPQDFYWLSYFNVGGFLQFKTLLAPTLNLTAGVRYDYNSRFEGNLNPRVGFVYYPTDKFTVKLLYGEAFLAASPYNAYQHYGSFVPLKDDMGNYTGFISFFYHLPNPDLKAERNRTLETSFRYKFSPQLSLFVNGYYNRWTEIIGFDYQSNVTFKGYPVETAEVPVNIGEANIYGGSVRLQTT
ncbi:MAG: TonB-dependent receptor, partial [Flammeovirgaceae bacterium]|nr:TonB-dependent receptor [Flammeovirgaceae bacterium]MDW8286563.1 TonB-dependent receptor [Flammeovirgaceae bacterium]